ncbi:energy transducer TonB [Marivirga arenosa]|uniref:Energy transducer TonB n=1 Tax=Marivirga arenosa TaxID=3059076 RepID=A0AA51N479_9BACT|nr:energy transducer TonB [Marivirga sp. ABR2-2]WMN05919.1 energy transducer TonB [Marivirga sp. ABR2-2]
MEHFKNATRELYSKRPLFFNVGLVLAISLCFIAFEFKVSISEDEKVEFPEEDIFILSQDVLRTTQPPKPKPKPVIEPKGEINIVEAKEVPSEEKPTEVEIEEVLVDVGTTFKIPDEKVEDNTVYNSGALEFAPKFNGGIEAFYEYISESIEYPLYEQKRNIEGRVVLTFVIEKDGSLTDVEILKGVSKGIDEEAKRVIENAPKWEAGRQRGRAVRVRMNIPIYFRLN